MCRMFSFFLNSSYRISANVDCYWYLFGHRHRYCISRITDPTIYLLIPRIMVSFGSGPSLPVSHCRPRPRDAINPPLFPHQMWCFLLHSGRLNLLRAARPSTSGQTMASKCWHFSWNVDLALSQNTRIYTALLRRSAVTFLSLPILFYSYLQSDFKPNIHFCDYPISE